MSISKYLYPVTQLTKHKLKRAKRLWAMMTGGENEAGRKNRYREIWTAILQAEAVDSLPHEQKIKAVPRIRGIGHAAKKAGF